ncbi:Holliday junction resolvase RuvX [Fibrella sp. WM1]|uniref:Holliday junction resolvase RuvX n=1 Tax=Fibrella musci TaxID=3242485 RepID=UPI00352078AF
MARLVAIDYGNKRTGLAVTDPLQLIATALETVPTHTLIDRLKAYAAAEPVEGFVVGWPTNTDGTDTDTTAAVRGLLKKLRTVFPEQTVYQHDERFTSRMALQAMIAGGTSKKDRRQKGAIDMVSATIILQSFMESKK